jgi:hypothetical protein
MTSRPPRPCGKDTVRLNAAPLERSLLLPCVCVHIPVAVVCPRLTTGHDDGPLAGHAQLADVMDVVGNALGEARRGPT